MTLQTRARHSLCVSYLLWQRTGDLDYRSQARVMAWVISGKRCYSSAMRLAGESPE